MVINNVLRLVVDYLDADKKVRLCIEDYDRYSCRCELDKVDDIIEEFEDAINEYIDERITFMLKNKEIKLSID